ncbi:MAG: hypothetical protein CM15mP46_4020 [Alphaproteobacteria bacterium]|nr:MAG: hypothetical protein CM15mP46_4020 [Alphaproteobacteria bacterium]
MMPRAVCGLRQRAALIDILDEFDGLILDGYGVINVGEIWWLELKIFASGGRSQQTSCRANKWWQF